MEISVHDLINVIAKKHHIELPTGSLEDLTRLDPHAVPSQFWVEVHEIVLPLIDQENIFSSKQDLYEAVPEEYVDEVRFIDDDNQLLSMSELRESIDIEYVPGDPLNRNELSDRYRKILKSNCLHAEYPVFEGLEEAWRLLEKHYDGVIKEKSILLKLRFHPLAFMWRWDSTHRLR